MFWGVDHLTFEVGGVEDLRKTFPAKPAEEKHWPVRKKKIPAQTNSYTPPPPSSLKSQMVHPLATPIRGTCQPHHFQSSSAVPGLDSATPSLYGEKMASHSAIHPSKIRDRAGQKKGLPTL